MLQGLKPPPDSTCRLCNRIGRKKKRILFKDWQDDKITLKIEHLLGIKLLYHYRLSNSVCEECLDKLNYLDAFVKCAIANQELFAELIKDTHYLYKGKPNVPATKKPKSNGQPISEPSIKPSSQLSVMPSSEPSIRPSSQLSVRPFSQLSIVPPSQPQRNPPPPVPRIQTCSYTVFTTNSKKGNSDNSLETVTTKKVYVKKKGVHTLHRPIVKSPYIVDSDVPSAVSRVSVKVEEEIDITSDGDDDTISTNEYARKEVNALPSQPQNKSSTLEISSVRSCTNEDHANCSHRETEAFHATEADSNDSDDCVVIEDEPSPKKLKLSTPEDRINKIQAEPPKVPLMVSQSSSEVKQVDVKQEVDSDCTEDISEILIKQESDYRDPDLLEQNLWSKVVTCPIREAEHRVRVALSCYKCNKSNQSYLFLLYHLMNQCCCKVTTNPASLVLSSSTLMKQCKKIDISEATLLYKVDKEIEMCHKNKANLKKEVKEISELTKVALVNYRKEEEIKLQKEIARKQSAISGKFNDVSQGGVALHDKEIETCPANRDNLREDVMEVCPENRDNLREDVMVVCPENRDNLREDVTEVCPENRDNLREDVMLVCPKNRDNLREDAMEVCPENRDNLREDVMVVCPENRDNLREDVTEVCPENRDNLREDDMVACPENRDNLREDVMVVSEPSKPASVNCGEKEETESQEDISCKQSANNGKSNDVSSNDVDLQEKEIETCPENRANLREDAEKVSDLTEPASVNIGEKGETKLQEDDSHKESENTEKLDDLSGNDNVTSTSNISKDDTPLLDCEVTCEDSDEDSSEEK